MRFFFVGLLFLLCACSPVKLETPSDSAVYIIQPGDTAYDIGQRYGVTVAQLLSMNGVKDARGLQVGQPITVPRASFRPRGEQLGPVTHNTEKVHFSAAKSFFKTLIWPVHALRMGSGFGYRGDKFHDGLDLVATQGTPIFAAHAGQVIYSAHGMSGYGNLIVLRSKTLLTIYAHNEHNQVSRGDYVEQGQQIGEVGATGRATGPHLHFEVRLLADDGKYYAVDPLRFIETGGRALQAKNSVRESPFGG